MGDSACCRRCSGPQPKCVCRGEARQRSGHNADKVVHSYRYSQRHAEDEEAAVYRILMALILQQSS